MLCKLCQFLVQVVHSCIVSSHTRDRRNIKAKVRQPTLYAFGFSLSKNLSKFNAGFDVRWFLEYEFDTNSLNTNSKHHLYKDVGAVRPLLI